MSVIRVLYGKPRENATVTIDLPCPVEKINEAIKGLYGLYGDLEGNELPINITGYLCEVEEVFRHISQTNVKGKDGLEKLNIIAGKLEKMDGRQRDIFGGALKIEKPTSLDDIIRVANSLGNYTLTPHLTREEELGVYVVNNGKMKFPDYVLPFLDRAAIGRHYNREHGGALTPSGYVQKAADGQEQGWEPEPPDTLSPYLVISLTAPKADAPVTLKLPATDERLDWTMALLGIGEFAEADILKIESCTRYLDGFVELDCPSIEQMNEVAQYCEDWLCEDEDQTKLLAVCEAVGADTWQGLLNIIKHLDEYQLYDAKDEDDFGRQVASEQIDDGDDPLTVLEGYIDFTSFGRYKMKEDNARHTSYGYVVSFGEPFPQLDQEQSDPTMDSMGGLA